MALTTFDSKTEYEEHAKYCKIKHNITLPAWNDLDDYDKAEWERWADYRNKLEREDSNE